MTQEQALAICKLGVNIFLTGEPGSGKTHTINQYIAWLQERGIEPAVTASTGIAATHINGMTIHAWSGIGIRRTITEEDVEYILSKEKTARRIIDAKVLVIDEISMLSGATLDNVDKVLRGIRRKPLMPEEPFGGLQVLFVGDFFQLPPISRDGPTAFAFESEAWKAANPVACYLTEQHRQDDPRYHELLGALRRGTLSSAHRDALESRIGTRAASRAATRLHTHNAAADRINEESLAAVGGKSKVFHMSSRGPKNLTDSLKDQCLSPETLTLKPGAQVMFTRNNFDEGYVNGTLGTVTGFANSGFPLVKMKDRTIEVSPQEWTMQDGNKILAQITQVPLRLAWAITVHKSQGMSLDSAIIDLGRAFEYGQGYVALSRLRSFDGLFLEGFNERSLMLHPNVVRQDALFRGKSAAAEKRFAELSKGEREKLEYAFLRAIGAKEPGTFERRTSEPVAAKKKPVKGETMLATKALLKERKTIKEIARERKLTEGTIIGHIEQLYIKGQIDADDCRHAVSGHERDIERAQDVLRMLGDTPLSTVFTRLKGTVSYDVIRLAKVMLAEG